MTKIGYIRICIKDKSAGKTIHTVTPDIIFTDASQTRAEEQTQLKNAIQSTHSGDQVFVEKLNQLGTSRMDALRNISAFTGKGATLSLIAEDLVFPAHADPMSILVKILLLKFKPSKTKSDGKKLPASVAPKSPTLKSKPKATLTAKQIAELKRRASAGENKTALARHFAISRTSLLAYLR